MKQDIMGLCVYDFIPSLIYFWGGREEERKHLPGGYKLYSGLNTHKQVWMGNLLLAH